MAWIWLGIAGVLEVVWAVGLKASEGFTRPWPTAIAWIGMVVSFVCLAQAMRVLPVGTAYAVWTGIGVVGTAVVGIVAFGEPRDSLRLLAMLAIIAGIVGLKLTAD